MKTRGKRCDPSKTSKIAKTGEQLDDKYDMSKLDNFAASIKIEDFSELESVSIDDLSKLLRVEFDSVCKKVFRVIGWSMLSVWCAEILHSLNNKDLGAAQSASTTGSHDTVMYDANDSKDDNYDCNNFDDIKEEASNENDLIQAEKQFRILSNRTEIERDGIDTDNFEGLKNGNLNGYGHNELARDQSAHETNLSEEAFYVCVDCENSFTSVQAFRKHIITEHGVEVFKNKKRLTTRTYIKRRIKGHSNEGPHVCVQCDKQFSTYRNMVQHQKTAHSDKLAHVCPECGKAYKWRRSLRKHKIRMHSGEARFACTKCNRKFFDRVHLLRHEKVHNKFYCTKCGKKFASTTDVELHETSCSLSCCSYVCTFCDKRLKSSKSLESHLSLHKPDRFNCNECSITFRTKRNLLRHMRIHTGYSPFVCAKCGKGFRELGHLKSHELAHTGARPHVCTICGKSYKWRRSLNKHKLKAHSGGEPKRACTKCDMKFFDSSELCRHVKRAHREDFKFSCEKCKRKFTTEIIMRGHVARCSGNPYDCSICSEKLTSSRTLRVHLKTHSAVISVIKIHNCDVCLKTFQTADVLKRHLETHSTERPYVCADCGKRFKAARNLQEHQLLHSGDRSHICSVCGKVYSWIRGLQKHILKEHGQRNIECPQCGRMFFQISDLNVHVKRVHEKHGIVRPYTCSICDKGYSKAVNLKKHEETHKQGPLRTLLNVKEEAA